MRSTKCAIFLLVSYMFCSVLPGNANVYYSLDKLLASQIEQLENKIIKRLESRLDTMQESMGRKFGEHMVALQRSENAKWLELDDKILVLKDAIKKNSGAYFDSCRGVPSELSNRFMIRPVAANTPPFLAYCEQQYLGGSWIVIHKRFDGKVDFNRSWLEYKEGFGEPEGEHWMGLEKIHKITRSDDHELLVVLKDFDGRSKTALYDGFEVDTEGAKYKLSVGQFVHGEAGDSLSMVSGARFSTNDQDNDQHLEDSCAEFYQSGWWFINCMNANLNGLYNKHDDKNMTMNWFTFRKDMQGLKEASMMIREKVKR